MAKKHSTGALTEEQKNAQELRYKEGHEYDYVFIGTGSSALTSASLLVNKGYSVCMLEAHDIPGGYLHSFNMGDYYFCAQVHYIWGCAPGGRVYEFLRHIGLHEDITFELMGPNGYDHMVMPDGKRVPVPYGFKNLAENIEKAYPGQKEKVLQFTHIINEVRKEIKRLPDRKIKWWEYLTKGHQFKNLLKYLKKTLQDVFDECGLSKEAQAVLCAQAGDFMLPPERLSFLAYTGLFAGYNTGSYYPTRHFKYYVERLVKFIEDHEGCHVYYESEVTKFNVEGKQIASVETADGKVFTAKKGFVCNMDPRRASHLIGREHFPADYKKSLDYEYSESGIMIYLGLKDIDLKKHGFGSYNIWHLEDFDMNKMWREMGEGNFENPWVFISTPTLHTDQPGTAPEGCHIMEIAAYTKYKPLKDLQDQNYSDYRKKKMELAEKMLDLVEKRYIPNLRDHIAVKVIGSNTTNEDFVLAPWGNAYGSDMTPENVSATRLKAPTPFSNLHWCNASSGWAGVHGTVTTGMTLYMDLTGDRFYDAEKMPSDDELVEETLKRQEKEHLAPA